MGSPASPTASTLLAKRALALLNGRAKRQAFRGREKEGDEVGGGGYEKEFVHGVCACEAGHA